MNITSVDDFRRTIPKDKFAIVITYKGEGKPKLLMAYSICDVPCFYQAKTGAKASKDRLSGGMRPMPQGYDSVSYSIVSRKE